VVNQPRSSEDDKPDGLEEASAAGWRVWTTEQSETGPTRVVLSQTGSALDLLRGLSQLLSGAVGLKWTSRDIAVVKSGSRWRVSLTLVPSHALRVGRAVKVAARRRTRDKPPLGRPRRIDEETVRRIVESRRAQVSTRRIAQDLETDGVLSPTGNSRWSHTTVQAVYQRWKKEHEN
jgi:hypothetical protein